MSTAPTQPIIAPAPRPTWTFTQTMFAWVVGTACFMFLIGAGADAYCEMQFAKKPIRGAIAHVIKKIGDALGLIPFVVPFLDMPDVPAIEHQTYRAADDGSPLEQDHTTFCED